MSERLRHLQRQQALLREHLAWIDAEIVRETVPVVPVISETPPATERPPAVTLATSAAPAAPSALADADALIERYASDERQNPDDIRRGCLLFFIGGLVVIAIIVAAIWFGYYR